ncbi:hypothetical protein [uncultured Merdimonas sp.]|uniref:hypothetical protein n=1 Tax=uncultured Merdimonas sp. TaxID=2023269 RepID=UPI003208E405
MKNSFFKTKEGGLTIAFIIIMISFFLIQGGLAAGMNGLAYLGLVLVIISMLYSPVKVFIIDRKK